MGNSVENVLEHLRILEMSIRNRQDRSLVEPKQLTIKNTRLFEDLMSYELATEELKKDCVDLLLEDAQLIATSDQTTEVLHDRVVDDLEKLGSLLKKIKSHEDTDIQKSKELQDFVDKARKKLDTIRENCDKKYDTYADQKEAASRSSDLIRRSK